MVASQIANRIGTGLRKRAASNNASSWVLSPISAKATMAVGEEEFIHDVFLWLA